jgi:drug/metabolite transporter (DMT)-like permease
MNAGPSRTQADKVIVALSAWMAHQGDQIDPLDMQQAQRIARKLRRGRVVWGVAFVIVAGLLLLVGLSLGLGLFALLGAAFVGGAIASVVSFFSSTPNRREQVFLARVSKDLDHM